jgi:hypothetical protein
VAAEEKEVMLYGGMMFDVKRVFINKLVRRRGAARRDPRARRAASPACALLTGQLRVVAQGV